MSYPSSPSRFVEPTVDNYSSGAPCDFQTLYNYDHDTLGNNLVDRQSEDLYLVKAGLIIGGGVNTTYFTDYGKCIVMGGAIYVSAYGHLTLGQSDGGKPYNGVQLFFRHPNSPRVFNLNATVANAYLDLYNCDARAYSYFQTYGNGVTQTLKSVNFNTWVGESLSVGGTPYFGGNQAIDRITIHRVGEGFRFQAAPGAVTYNDIKIVVGTGGTTRGFMYAFMNLQNTTITVRNAVIEGSPLYSFSLIGGTYIRNVIVNMVDPTNFDCATAEAPTGGCDYSGTQVNKLYTVYFTVRKPNGTGIIGANVTITNAIGTFSGVTTPMGWVTIEVPVQRKDMATGVTTDGSSCTVTIKKPGYNTIVDKTSISSKINDTKTLKPVFTIKDLAP